MLMEKGISISADRIKVILALPGPKCIEDNRGFLDALSYTRSFLDGFAEITAPLVRRTRSDVGPKTVLKKLSGLHNVKRFSRQARPNLCAGS